MRLLVVLLMALSAKVAAFNTTTGTADVVVTGTGFTPKALIVWSSGRTGTVDASGRASQNRLVGFAASATDERGVATMDADAQGTSIVNRGHENANLCNSVDAGTLGFDGKLQLKSFDANGFTLGVTDAFPRDQRVHYLALGGDDITNVKTGQFQEPGATGNQDITDVLFQPDVVFLLSIGFATAPPASTGGAGGQGSISLGVMGGSSPVPSWVMAAGAEDAVGSADTQSHCRGAAVISLFPDTMANAVDGRATFVQMLSNGFRINWVERISTRYVFYLAIKGGSWWVDSLLTSVTLNATIAETGFGFQPRGALFASSCHAESAADTAESDDEWSLGAFDSTTSRGCHGSASDDAAPTMIVSTAVSHDECYFNMLHTDGTVQGEMDISTVDADGFTMIMDDGDNAANFVGYVAFGDTAVAAGANPVFEFRVPSFA